MKTKFNKYESASYWTQHIQLMLNATLNQYMEETGITQKEFATKLGVSKGYVSQILNGSYDHKLSKLVELAMACGKIPKFEFVPNEYAEEVAKETYFTTKDWKRFGNLYFRSLNIPDSSMRSTDTASVILNHSCTSSSLDPEKIWTNFKKNINGAA